MYGCQCPKRLYLHKFKYKEADPYDEQAMLIFKRGTDVGELAQGVFPGGVDAQGDDPYPGYDSAMRTDYYMRQGVDVIYEATFIFNDVLVAVDILVKTPDGYAVYEVKSTNRAKPQHEQDGAVQYHVLEGKGVKISAFYIMHFNPEYVLRGELDLQGLFKSTEITKACKRQQTWVAVNIELFHGVLAKEEPNIAMGDQCNKPYPCNFQGYCTKVKDESRWLLDNYREGEVSAVAEKAIAENEVLTHGQVPEPVEGVEGSVDPSIHFDTIALEKFTSRLKYPLYFFDFETIMSGVPEFQESRPYQQVPFQYSLHIRQTPGADLEHKEFLAEAGSDPREALIHQLKEHFGDTGSILVWYQSFEESRLRELVRDFPAHTEFLESLIARLDDLIIPFKQGWVSSEAFGGSSSIKNVLPVMVPELSYKDLTIQEGGTASYTFGQLSEMPADSIAQTRSDLLEYCKLDTLAMVKIWEQLVKV